MLNLKHLYYFHVFAQELNTGRAAKRLGITSPSLSNQLKGLESHVGAPFTRRVNGRVEFTEHGKLLADYADQMFSIFEELTLKLADAKSAKESSLNVAISTNVAVRFALDLISIFEKNELVKFNRVKLEFCQAEAMLEGYARKQFDLILGAFEPDSNPLSYPVQLFASRSLLPVDLKDAEEIIQFINAHKIALILPMKSSLLRKETDTFFAKVKSRPSRTIECNSASGMIELVERGLGLVLAPTPCLIDLESAVGLVAIGPAKGYWIHHISILVQPRHQNEMTKK